MSRSLKILALSPVPPDALHHGISLRVHHFLLRLRRHNDVTLVHFRDQPQPERRTPVPGIRIVSCDPPARPPVSRAAKLLAAVRLGSPYPQSEPMLRTVRHLLEAEPFEAVMTFHPDMLWYALNERGAPIVADLIDEPTLAIWRALRLAPRGLERLRMAKRILEMGRYERATCPRAAYCLVASDSDAVSLRRIAPRTRVGVLPNGVAMEFFQPSNRAPEPHSLVFVGNLDSAANVAGVQYFYRRVLPRIRQSCPTVQWYVVGANPPQDIVALAADPSVSVTGFLDDVRPYLERASIVVSPLISGGGIKNKVLEAWAMGKAVVSTPIGCAGLRAIDDENIAIATGAPEFADRTLALLQRPEHAAALGRAGRQTVERFYSWDAQAARLEAFLQDAVTKNSHAQKRSHAQVPMAETS
jgi:polysaccharide biosynthesis protein PslH